MSLNEFLTSCMFKLYRSTPLEKGGMAYRNIGKKTILFLRERERERERKRSAMIVFSVEYIGKLKKRQRFETLGSDMESGKVSFIS